MGVGAPAGPEEILKYTNFEHLDIVEQHDHSCDFDL